MITYNGYNNGYNNPMCNAHKESVHIIHRSTLHMAKYSIFDQGEEIDKMKSNFLVKKINSH